MGGVNIRLMKKPVARDFQRVGLNIIIPVINWYVVVPLMRTTAMSFCGVYGPKSFPGRCLGLDENSPR